MERLRQVTASSKPIKQIRQLGQRALMRVAKIDGIGELACFEVKMIGKPYAGELHVRFDEGEQDLV